MLKRTETLAVDAQDNVACRADPRLTRFQQQDFDTIGLSSDELFGRLTSSTSLLAASRKMELSCHNHFGLMALIDLFSFAG